jgi:hypothetical protein
MNTQEKCEAILQNIVKRCNEDGDAGSGKPVVSFAPDWGGNSLTLYIGEDHTHVGHPESTFDNLIDRLYAQLLEGKGLSFQIQIGDTKA